MTATIQELFPDVQRRHVSLEYVAAEIETIQHLLRDGEVLFIVGHLSNHECLTLGDQKAAARIRMTEEIRTALMERRDRLVSVLVDAVDGMGWSISKEKMEVGR